MYDIYTIKQNDTIESIAKNNNITIDKIYDLNGNIQINPGMTIILPKKNNNEFFDYYTISKGDTLYGIARKYNMNYKVLAELNGLEENDYIYPGQRIIIPKKNVKIYITAEGDTLQGILNGIKANVNKFINQNGNIYLLPEQLIVYKE